MLLSNIPPTPRGLRMLRLCFNPLYVLVIILPPLDLFYILTILIRTMQHPVLVPFLFVLVVIQFLVLFLLLLIPLIIELRLLFVVLVIEPRLLFVILTIGSIVEPSIRLLLPFVLLTLGCPQFYKDIRCPWVFSGELHRAHQCLFSSMSLPIDRSRRASSATAESNADN